MNALILSGPNTVAQRYRGYQSLGCPDCGGKCGSLLGLGAVEDYDYITISGKQYTANQLLGKEVIASKDVTLYPSLFSDSGKFIVKQGQSIGKVFSYLKPSNKSNPTGKVVLIFERGYNVNYYLKDDNAVSTQALKDQGTLTVEQELKAQEEAAKRDADPIGYYLKKFGLPLLLIGGSIYLASSYGKEVIKAKLAKQ